MIVNSIFRSISSTSYFGLFTQAFLCFSPISESFLLIFHLLHLVWGCALFPFFRGHPHSPRCSEGSRICYCLHLYLQSALAESCSSRCIYNAWFFVHLALAQLTRVAVPPGSASSCISASPWGCSLLPDVGRPGGRPVRTASG